MDSEFGVMLPEAKIHLECHKVEEARKDLSQDAPDSRVCQHLDFGHLASRTMKRNLSVISKHLNL